MQLTWKLSKFSSQSKKNSSAGTTLKEIYQKQMKMQKVFRKFACYISAKQMVADSISSPHE